MNAMEYQDGQPAPQLYARLAGIIYLIVIVVGMFGQLFVRGTLIVPGDAVTTAENIMASETLWRASIGAELFMLTGAVIWALLFYLLLRPVHRNLALLATFFTLVSVALEAANKLHLLAALFPLGVSANLQAFSPEQLYVQASYSVQAHDYGFAVNLIFFGCTCLVLGYLIFRSGYLPRVIGVLMVTAGFCYLTNSFAMIVAPPLAALIFPAIMFPVFIGEVSLCLWLLVKGVNIPTWTARVKAMPASSKLTAALQ